MLTRSRLAASVGAASAWLALSTATAAAAPPLPTDGSGSCASQFCTVVAEHPAKPPRVITGPWGTSFKDTTPDPAPAQVTQAQLINSTAWDAHVNTLCTNARVGGTAMPAECLPAPARPAGAPAPAARPGDATKKAMQQLRAAPAKIGSAPCAMTEPGCIGGAVGVPVWLWTQQPWTPQTATATAGPYTVTAVARPTSVTWNLGDGQRLTCQRGTPYELSWGFRDSPDCGTRYERVGKYSITATMTYDVTWSGADTGSATIQSAPTSVPVDIGEYQVVIHHSG